MPSDAKLLIARFSELKNQRANFESMWQEIADHLMGRRDFLTKRTPGQKRNQRIYDTTAADSIIRLASALHSLLTNTESRWFGLSTEDDSLMKDRDASIWITDATDRMINEFARPNARFTPQAHEMYYDLIGFGTGGQFIDDRPGDGVIFSTRPLSEMYLSEDINGVVDTIYRSFEMTSRQAWKVFGAATPRRVRKDLEDNKPERRREYLHCVAPNEDLAIGNIDVSGMPWSSYYIFCEDSETIGTVGGYWEMPYQTPRWNKDTGESYGRGPGVTALPDGQMLNEMSRTTLKGAQKQVDPPYFIPNDGLLSNVRMQPGGATVVDQNFFERSNGQPVTSLPPTANIALGVDMEERRATNIRRAFHHELLQMFEDPRMSATQVIELRATAQRMMSPTLGRQKVEYLEPMLERVWGIMLRAGKFGPVPEILAGQNIKIDYISPVARAQKAEESSSVSRTLAQAIEVSQIQPEVLDNFDLDEAFRFISANNDLPPRILRDPRIVQAIRQQRAEAQAAQQKFEMMNEAAKTGSRLLPAEAKAEQLRRQAA